MKNFWNIIAFMLLALVSLIAIQWYWIQNAIEVKKEQFDKSVLEAMNATVAKIEKQEVIFLAKQRIREEEQKKLEAIASKPKIIYRTVTKPKEDLHLVKKEENKKNKVKVAVVRPEIGASPTDILGFRPQDRHFTAIKQLIADQNQFWEYFDKSFAARNREQIEIFNSFIAEPIRVEIIENREPETKKEIKIQESSPSDYKEEVVFNKTSAKAKIVQEVFTDFLKGDRNILERINQQMLDTLLKEEMHLRGVNIPYEYAIQDQGELLFCSTANTSKDADYKVRLFPNDVVEKQQFLHVSVPKRDELIFNNMHMVWGSSAALILLVSGVFFASVNTMLKQKKLSMIKNDFINNMTHELKTPISTISLAVEVMKDPDVKTPDTSRYLNIISSENKRLESQVEKVLQIALLDKNKISLHKEEIDVHEMLANVKACYAMKIERLEGSFQVNLKAQNAKIMADAVHMNNVFHNLLDNAIKYSKEVPNVTISTFSSPEYLQIDIQDEGLGLTREDMKRVFDKFYRVHTGNLHNVKGFGLGLSYVKKMVELHNGHVKVSSKHKVGSTFSVYLPLKS